MQVRISAGLLLDPRFKELVAEIEKDDLLTHHACEELAIGKCFRAFHLAQDYWRDGRQLIPKKIWNLQSNASFASLFLQVGLAEERDNEIYVCGAKQFFDWYHDKREAGREGGLASGKARRNRNKSNDIKDNSEANEADLQSIEPVLFCSSSVSVLKEEDRECDNALSPPSSLIAIWNANCGPLPKARLTGSQATKIKARLNEQPDLAYWEACIKRLAASDFATGKNDRGWKADFRWLMRNDDNHVKVNEGKYDNRGAKPRGQNYTVITDLRQLADE